MEQVWKTIEKYDMLQSGDCIIVGVSGGPDSVALLYLLKQYQEVYSLNLHVVHVNHMFRGQQALDEAAFVQKLAEEWSIPCTIFHKEVAEYALEQGLSSQAAGHNIRHQCFEEVAQKIGANKLALGHHRDDRVETVLLHLVQGCGLDGLASMPIYDGRVIRPLSDVGKKELIDYCKEQSLPYCLDPSNQKEVYLRNRVRLKLIPFLEEQFNPKIKDGLIKLEELAREDNHFLEQMAEQAYSDCVRAQQEKIIVQLDRFHGLHLSLKRRVIRRIYQELLPQEQGLDFQGVSQVLSLAEQNSGYKTINLAKGVVAEKKYNSLSLMMGGEKGPHSKCETQYWQWEEQGELCWMDYCFSCERSEIPVKRNDDWFTVVLDGELVGKELEIRQRGPGDRIKPVGLKGTKKLKDFFIDRKVPKDQRERCPIITNGREIVWIPGYTIGDQFKVNETTKVYLILRARKI